MPVHGISDSDALGNLEDQYDTAWVARECDWFESRLNVDPGLKSNNCSRLLDGKRRQSLASGSKNGLKYLP
jgi:hypothetical protein